MHAMITLLAAQETPADEAPSPIVPHTPEIIVGLIAFGILYYFLKKYVIPLFERTFAERTAAIEGGIEKAERAQAEAQRLLEQYRAQLAEARHEAAKLREQAREQGAAIIAEMREQAQAEARRITEAAHAQIEADKTVALTSLRREVGTLAVALASRVVGESLEEEARQRRMIERFLSELEAAPAGAGVGAAGAGGEPGR
jgi:F-type H+-transporting ATPase subunit b